MRWNSRWLKLLAGLAIVVPVAIYGAARLLEAPSPEDMAAYRRTVVERNKQLPPDRQYDNCLFAARGTGTRLTCAATAPSQQQTAFILRCSDRGDVILLFRDAGQADAGKYLDVAWLFDGGVEWAGRWRYSGTVARARENWVFWKFLGELEHAKGAVRIRLGATSVQIPLHSLADALAAFKRRCPVLE